MKNALLFLFIFFTTVILGTTMSMASSKGAKKVQEVNFEEQAIDGEARKPDGAYLVQKRGVDFVPLYNIRSQFEESIKESVDYLR